MNTIEADVILARRAKTFKMRAVPPTVTNVTHELRTSLLPVEFVRMHEKLHGLENARG